MATITNPYIAFDLTLLQLFAKPGHNCTFGLGMRGESQFALGLPGCNKNPRCCLFFIRKLKCKAMDSIGVESCTQGLMSTQQRKGDHYCYTILLQSDATDRCLLGKVQNSMHCFPSSRPLGHHGNCLPIVICQYPVGFSG